MTDMTQTTRARIERILTALHAIGSQYRDFPTSQIPDYPAAALPEEETVWYEQISHTVLLTDVEPRWRPLQKDAYAAGIQGRPLGEARDFYV